MLKKKCNFSCVLVEYADVCYFDEEIHMSCVLSLGGVHKQSYCDTVLNSKHVWGIRKSRCSSSAFQHQGNKQGVQMYHSDARQHYK